MSDPQADYASSNGGERRRKGGPLSRIVSIAALPVFFLLAFTICYVSATHAPSPHDMALTLAGTESTTQQVADAISKTADGAFDISRTTSEDSARSRVEERRAVGALIIDGNHVTTVLASGGGRLASGVVQQAGEQVAASLNGTATVEDVAPLPAHDPGGSSLFYFFIVCSVGAFLTITMVSQVLPKARTRTFVLATLGASLVAPTLGFSMVSLFVDFGASFGTDIAVIGIGMIVSLTVGLFASLFARLLGGGAIIGIILFLVALNFPSAGGTSPESMLPPFWQAIHNVWLGAGGFEAMRSVMYFDGHQAGRWLVQLLIWTLLAIVLLVAVTILMRRRRTPAAPNNETLDAAESAEAQAELAAIAGVTAAV